MTVPTNSTKPGNSKHLEANLRGVKICHIATVPFHMVSQLKNQVEYMRDIGMNVILVSSDGPELSKIKLGYGLSHEIVEIPRSLQLWKDFIAFIKLIRIFHKHKFDIIHSTTPKAGLLSSIAAFLVRVPVRLHTWTGQQWVTLNGPMRWVSRLADNLIGILNTRCYADSKSQRQFLVDERIITSKKIAVIGHGSLAGVNLDRFDPERWSLSERQRLRQDLSISPDSRVLIFIGRLTREKGISELISAFHGLLHLGYNVDLLLVGPFDQDCGGTGSIDSTDIDQCSRMHYVGYADCPERYLAISDIFCLPSYREGFGTTVIEAGAMAIPTVGTHINGLLDAIANGETGILVPPQDEQSLLYALKKLLDEPDLADRMGKAARQRCVRQFDMNIVNEKVAAEYMRLLKRT